jgi:N-acetylglucosaminyldiphosphoundecaprenol N-acetyl-beta-D-mannosaminyltransferase
MAHASDLPQHDADVISGVSFDFLDIRDAARLIDGWRRRGRRGYVALVNPHSVMLCKRDEQMRSAVEAADLVLPDGVGIVLAARILGYGRRHRVTGPNLMLHLCDAGREMGLRHFFYGGGAGVAERLAERLSGRYPGLEVAGYESPPFRELSSDEDRQAVDRINAARPDIVWVGIGAPKQEKWMVGHRRRVHASAIIGVGAAFDFHSGAVRWAPSWIRRLGCEWAYRLVLQPRRMWRRNLDSPLFLGHVLCQGAARALAALALGVKQLGTKILGELASFWQGPPDGGSGAGAAMAASPMVVRDTAAGASVAAGAADAAS